MANELALRNALREKLANELTHRNSLSAGGGVSEPVERLGILPPWYQTLSGERAGQGFVEALQAINQNRGDLQVGDTSINPIDFVNPVAGIFGGKLAKTADLMALRDAMNRATAGDDAQKIWQETGWFKSPDGQWRFEIDDSASQLFVGEKPVQGPLSHYLAHENAYKAYPDTDLINFTSRPSGPNEGSYSDIGDAIFAHGDNRHSTTLHELQHAIQQREGFARGGSPGGMKREASELKLKLDDLMRQRGDMEAAALRKAGLNEYGYSPEQVAIRREVHQAPEYLASLDETRRIGEQYDLVTSLDDYGMDAYQRLAGEAEARAVQSRMNLTPEQRRMRFPLDDYDVPVDELIMRYGDNGPNLATVWHGSPHRFDKFDLSKIGTGEGAQAYGHGLYFADTQDVATRYRDTLTNFRPDHIEARLIDAGVSPELANTYAQFAAQKQGGARAFDDFEAAIMETSPSPYIEQFRQRLRAELPKAREASGAISGSLYKVDLPDDQIANMLDWDAPLSQQPEAVRRALEPVIAEMRAAGRLDRNGPIRRAWENPTGETVYNALASYRGGMNKGMPDATAVMRELGIPGIKYFDGGSRAAGEGTRNYVVFDDNLPKILERR